MGKQSVGYRWGVRCGRALLELLGAREVVREMDRQAAKQRKEQDRKKKRLR